MLSIRLFLIVFAVTSRPQSSAAAAAGDNHSDASTAAWSDANQTVIEQLNRPIVTSKWS